MSEVTNSITASAVPGGAAPGEAELLLPQLLGRHQRQLAARGRKKKEKKKEKCCVNREGGQIKDFQIQMAGGWDEGWRDT